MFRTLKYSPILMIMLSFNAFAQTQNVPQGREPESHGDMRAKSNEWMLPPANTANLGLRLESITTSEDLTNVTGDDKLKLTDVALLRLTGDYSAADRAQIFLHAAILPKQTSNMTENIFQNAGLGLRLGLAKNISGTLAFRGGTTAATNVYGEGSLGLQTRFKLDRYVRLSGSLGASGFTTLGSDRAKFVETDIGLELGFFNPRSGGLWLGADYHIPVWSIDREFSHDPQNRLNLGVGGVLTFIDHWDLFAMVTLIDRGDIENPETILPILDGGFDQTKISFGITYRFEGASANNERAAR